MKINRIAVIGAGNMGHQIALHAAISGFKVKCFDINPDTLEKANQFVDEYLPGRVAKKRLTQAQADVARANIQFTNSLETAVSDADYVIEAVLEVLDIKRALFKDLDRLAPPHAILASNSSAIVSSKIADALWGQEHESNAQCHRCDHTFRNRSKSECEVWIIFRVLVSTVVQDDSGTDCDHGR